MASSTEELASTYAATLSLDATTRHAAEAHLQQLQSQPACFITLVNLLLPTQSDAAHPLSIRQAAAIGLRALIKKKWSPFFDGFDGYPPSTGAGQPEALPLDIKTGVRQALLQVLIQPERKLRLAAANALATLATCDFPDEFPELLPFLSSQLAALDAPSSAAGAADGQANISAVHGAMIFLTDFVHTSLDGPQLLSVASRILPSLESLLAHHRPTYGAHICARAVSVVRQLLETLYMLRDQNGCAETHDRAFDELLPKWLPALIALVGDTDDSQRLLADGDAEPRMDAWEALALRHQALQTLHLATHFKSHFATHIGSALRAALQTLTSLSPAFDTVHLREGGSEAPVGFPREGDEDIASSIPRVVSSAIELLCTLLRFSPSVSSPKSRAISSSNNARALLQTADAPGASSLLSQVILGQLSYAQMTTDEHDEWSDDVNLFIAQQAEEEAGGLGFGLADAASGSVSLRVIVSDAIADYLDALPLPTLAALNSGLDGAAQRHASSGDWKPLESALACVGGNADAIAALLDASSSSSSDAQRIFQLEQIFQSAVVPCLSPGPAPFLRGQAFVFASHFAALLPPHVARQLLDAAVSALEAADQETVVVVSAIRTVKNLYRVLPSEVTQGYAEQILARIGPMLTSSGEGNAGLQGDAIVLLLETVQAVVVVSQQAAATGQAGQNEIPDEAYGEIVGVSLACYMKEPNDIVLASIVQDLLEALAGKVSPSVGAIVVRTALASLVSTLDSSSATTAGAAQTASMDFSAVATSGLDTLAAVLRGAEPAALEACAAADVLLPAVMGVIGSFAGGEDRELVQNGVTVLTLLLVKVPARVVAWRSTESGAGSIEMLLQLVARLLDPSDEGESGGLVLGALIMTLLRKASAEISPHLRELLAAMVQRLHTAKTMSLAQSLLAPLSYLLITESRETILELLTSVQVHVDGPTGQEAQDGLQVFVTRWVDEAETVQGAWAKKVNAIALTKIFESGIPALQQLFVKGDVIPDPSGTIITRSRAKKTPDQYTRVPLGTKILKLLLEEWSHASDEGVSAQAADDEDDDDEGWDDDDDAGAGGRSKEGLLSDMIAFDESDFFDDDDAYTSDLFTGLTADELKHDDINTVQLKRFIHEWLLTQAPRPEAQHLATLLDAPTQALLQKAVAS